MAFIVETTGEWFLRGTTWTSDRDRAIKFDTEEDAQAGLLKAKKFTKPEQYKAARVISTEAIDIERQGRDSCGLFDSTTPG
jgi:hypothetical protein